MLKIAESVKKVAYNKSSFLSQMPEARRRILDMAIIWDLGALPESEEEMISEWKTTCRNQLIRFYRGQISNITETLKKADNEDESGELSLNLSKLASKLLLLEKDR